VTGVSRAGHGTAPGGGDGGTGRPQWNPEAAARLNPWAARACWCRRPTQRPTNDPARSRRALGAGFAGSVGCRTRWARTLAGPGSRRGDGRTRTRVTRCFVVDGSEGTRRTFAGVWARPPPRPTTTGRWNFSALLKPLGRDQLGEKGRRDPGGFAWHAALGGTALAGTAADRAVANPPDEPAGWVGGGTGRAKCDLRGGRPGQGLAGGRLVPGPQCGRGAAAAGATGRGGCGVLRLPSARRRTPWLLEAEEGCANPFGGVAHSGGGGPLSEACRGRAKTGRNATKRGWGEGRGCRGGLHLRGVGPAGGGWHGMEQVDRPSPGTIYDRSLHVVEYRGGGRCGCCWRRNRPAGWRPSNL